MTPLELALTQHRTVATELYELQEEQKAVKAAYLSARQRLEELNPRVEETTRRLLRLTEELERMRSVNDT